VISSILVSVLIQTVVAKILLNDVTVQLPGSTEAAVSTALKCFQISTNGYI